MDALTPLNERLAWLAGILDGEGYLSATVNSSKAGYRSEKTGRPKRGGVRELRLVYERSLRFQVRVGNTDAAMIREIGMIADTLGISYFVFSFSPKQRGGGRYKELFGIHFHGKNRVKRLLQAVLPWLVTKRPQAELLLEMVVRREQLTYHTNSLSDPVLYEQLLRLRGLNRRGVPGDGSATALDQLPAKTLGESHSPSDVVGPQQEGEHVHLTGPHGVREEPSGGMGVSPRR